MIQALFVVFPVISHYNSCFGFADNLRKNGCRVVFTGSGSMRTYVEEQGFDFVVLEYISEYATPHNLDALRAFISNRLDVGYIKRKHRNFLLEINNFRKVCLNVKPEEIYLDEHLNHYYPIAKSESKVVKLFNTKLPTRRVAGIPPLTCSMPANYSPINTFYCWLSWEIYLLKRHLESNFNNIILNGQTSEKWINKLSIKLGILYKRQRNNAFYDNVTTAPIINLVPRQIEYPWYKPLVNEQFIFHWYNRKNINIDSETLEMLRLIYQQRINKKIKLVYCSLGSLNGAYPQVVTPFFHKLIKAFHELPDIHLLISSMGLKKTFPNSLPNNVTIFDWVPQPEVLSHCDVMITHGGMNTICECLMMGVPMIVYPLNLKTDQPGNAARVTANKWGIQGGMRKCTEHQILNAIEEVLDNEYYRQNVIKVHTTIIRNVYSF